MKGLEVHVSLQLRKQGQMLKAPTLKPQAYISRFFQDRSRRVAYNIQVYVTLDRSMERNY